MTKISLKLSLNKIGIVTFMYLFALYSSLMYENVFSRPKWNRDYIQVKYDIADNSIYIKCKFIHYEFGSFGEHAYFELMNIYLFVDTKYEHLLSCEVVDQQLYDNYSWLAMNIKLKDAKIQVFGCFPLEPCSWSKIKDNAIIKVPNNSKEASFILKLSLSRNVNRKVILVNGNWHINGLNCTHHIGGQKYTIDQESDFDIPGNSASKRTNKDIPHIDNFENNTVKVFKEVDAIVIKGALSKTIRVYSTTGAFVKSVVADCDKLQIALPAKQLYIVNVGQDRYKVAL